MQPYNHATPQPPFASCLPDLICEYYFIRIIPGAYVASAVARTRYAHVYFNNWKVVSVVQLCRSFVTTELEARMNQDRHGVCWTSTGGKKNGLMWRTHILASCTLHLWYTWYCSIPRKFEICSANSRSKIVIYAEMIYRCNMPNRSLVQVKRDVRNRSYL